MIAPGLGRGTEAQLADRQQKQRHADELEEERPRLLDFPAARRDCRLFRRDPKA